MKKKEENSKDVVAELLVQVVGELRELRQKMEQPKRRLDNRSLDVFDMDYTPSPFSRIPITTQNEALEQILVRSGMMSRETWEVLAGIQYDAVGESVEDDAFLDVSETAEDGEFEQSRFASYYERKIEKIEVPNVETKKVDVAPAPEKKMDVKDDNVSEGGVK